MIINNDAMLVLNNTFCAIEILKYKFIDGSNEIKIKTTDKRNKINPHFLKLWGSNLNKCVDFFFINN